MLHYLPWSTTLLTFIHRRLDRNLDMDPLSCLPWCHHNLEYFIHLVCYPWSTAHSTWYLCPVYLGIHRRLMSQTSLLLTYRMFIKYCVFSEVFKNIPDSGLSLFSLGVSVYAHQTGRKPPALQQNWQSSEKSQNFKEKTQYLMNTL